MSEPGETFDAAGVPWHTGIAGQVVGFPSRTSYVATARTMRDAGYSMCSDLCGVDYMVHSGRTLPEGVVPERFEVVANLLDLSERRRVRVRVQVPDADPAIESLFDIYPGVEAMEREVFDMLGISFNGHPDLTRILMPEDWEGHPLRKDYDIGSIPIRFKEAGVSPENLVHTGQERAGRLGEAASAASSRSPAGRRARLPHEAATAASSRSPAGRRARLPLPGRKGPAAR